MAGLRESLKRMMALPEREMPEWLLAAKRSGRTLDFLFTELRDCRQVRRVAEPRVKPVLPVPVITPAAIDAENRRRLLAVGREVYRDRSFRDSITDSLRQREQHRKNLDDARRIGRELLEE